MSSEDRLLGGRKHCNRTRRVWSRTAAYFHMQQILAQTVYLLHCCKIYNIRLERPMFLGPLSVLPVTQELECILQLLVTDLVRSIQADSSNLTLSALSIRLRSADFCR